MRNTFFVLFMLLFAACTQVIEPAVETSGDKIVYIVNNGNWGDNNADICIYDIDGKQLSGSIFAGRNGKCPGDLAQDILHIGEQLYISVNGSKIVYITDEELGILREVVARNGDNTLSPRQLCYDGEYVYVTYYEGFLGRIDKQGELVITAVGPNPDGLACLNGKIYVANSGGYLYPKYNNTLSVVDAASFKEESVLEVDCNPATVRACGGKIYVSHFGNFAEIGPSLLCVEPETGKTSRLPYEAVSGFDCCGDCLYVLCGGYDENFNPLPGTVNKYDCAAGKDLGSWISDGSIVEKAYSISCAAGKVWIGSSDYKNEGDVSVFDANGCLYDSFGSGGLNPIRIIE